jgi:hypothetical protein
MSPSMSTSLDEWCDILSHTQPLKTSRSATYFVRSYELVPYGYTHAERRQLVLTIIMHNDAFTIRLMYLFPYLEVC